MNLKDSSAVQLDLLLFSAPSELFLMNDLSAHPGELRSSRGWFLLLTWVSYQTHPGEQIILSGQKSEFITLQEGESTELHKSF